MNTTKRSRTARGASVVVMGQAHRDGAGVKLRKMLGGRALSMLDPFLMLDEFKSDDPRDYLAGFPEHPHRGFETVTIMIDGVVEHRDSVGNQGAISGGGIQWMTAGKGIIHAEMPRPSETGGMWGYQLWVNLPAAKKMTKPRYQELKASDFASVDVDGASVRVLAGKVGGVEGPLTGIEVQPTALDVTLPAGATFRHDLPATHNAFLQILEGNIELPDATRAGDRSLIALEQGDVVEVKASSGASSTARFLVFAGAPIGEPVARYGPFVMNTDAEIRQAIEDYRAGRLTG